MDSATIILIRLKVATRVSLSYYISRIRWSYYYKNLLYALLL